ncbi:tripartite tricarboxylate transporter substrate binding protein [Alcaligenaceae bacterium A4P071]|nr:tripartite tricarboxylate transporter substrate binding protein [Alcaligenaceae bacterium A4P071]
MKRTMLLSWVAMSLLAVAGSAHAAYPDRPIKMIVPFPPGGGTDVVARVVGKRLAEVLGQAVVIENRPGASTVIGAEAVARAEPDGYTLLMTGSTTYSILPALKKNLNYDPQKSFAPIAVLALAPVVLVTRTDLGISDLPALAKYARERADKGKVSYGTFGAGSAPHLAGLMMSQAFQADMLDVPYKGSAQMVTALIGGELDMGVDTAASAAPQVAAGKIKALAVTGANRVPSLPNVPTFAEAGYPSVDFLGWYGMAAPAGTPQAVIDTLGRAVATTMADETVKRTIAGNALEPVNLGPDVFRDRMAAEIKTFTAIGQRANVSIE